MILSILTDSEPTSSAANVGIAGILLAVGTLLGVILNWAYKFMTVGPSVKKQKILNEKSVLELVTVNLITPLRDEKNELEQEVKKLTEKVKSLTPLKEENERKNIRLMQLEAEVKELRGKDQLVEICVGYIGQIYIWADSFMGDRSTFPAPPIELEDRIPRRH